jgi:capsular exopolysaccharide synthesis family protein
MTTLPQTLPSRIPDDQVEAPRGTNGHASRYAGPSMVGASLPTISHPLSIPGQPGGGGSGGLTGTDIARVLRENLWLILLAAVLSGAAGFGLNEYLKKHQLTYTATGQLLLRDAEGFDPLEERNRRFFRPGESLETRMLNAVFSLQSDQLRTQLLQETEGPIRESEWLRRVAGDGSGGLEVIEAKEALQENFSATPQRGSQYIRVSFDADDGKEAADILTHMVNTRIKQLELEGGQRSTFDITESERLIRGRQIELRNLQAEIRQARQDSQGGDGGTAWATRMELSNLNDIRRVAEQEAAALRTELADARAAIQRGADPAAIEEIVSQNVQVAQLRNRVFQLESFYEELRLTAGENSQQLQQAGERLEAARRRAADIEADARAQARGTVVQQLEAKLEQAERAAADAAERIRVLDDRLEELASNSALIAELDEKRRELQRRLAANEEELELMKREAAIQPYVPLAWADQPTRPSSPSWPKLPLTVAGCLLAGVGLAVGLAFLREVLDTSVRSPRDIARVAASSGTAVPMPVLGSIPDENDDPHSSGPDKPLELSIAHSPHSMTAEQFRTARGRLARIAPLETTRSILVTGPQPGDGKTTIACNLAAGLALNGRRTLLVDANFRRPRLHEIFAIDNSQGLAACLEDADLLEEAAFPYEQVPNLHVLPAGPRPHNVTELIEGSNFADVLDRALESYDVIIFDSGPILFTSETSAMAPQVDGVVSVVRAAKSSRGLLGRLQDSLASLNVEHLGIILNGVQARAGGYYKRNIRNYYRYQQV